MPIEGNTTYPNKETIPGRGMSPSLSEQTPGLENESKLNLDKVKDYAQRPYFWLRNRPTIALSILGGLVVVGVGTFFAIRAGRRQTRWEMLRDRTGDLYEWMRSKF